MSVCAPSRFHSLAKEQPWLAILTAQGISFCLSIAALDADEPFHSAGHASRQPCNSEWFRPQTLPATRSPMIIKTCPLDILYPECPSGPEWYRCVLSVDRSWTTHLKAAVRRNGSATPLDHLFQSWGFRACLDQVFEDILIGAGVLGKTENRINPLMYSSARGAGNHGSRSPYLTFSLPKDLSGILETLSQHERMAIAASAARVARLASLRRLNFPASRGSNNLNRVVSGSVPRLDTSMGDSEFSI